MKTFTKAPRGTKHYANVTISLDKRIIQLAKEICQRRQLTFSGFLAELIVSEAEKESREPASEDGQQEQLRLLRQIHGRLFAPVGAGESVTRQSTRDLAPELAADIRAEVLSRANARTPRTSRAARR
jgi:hypothetical protein